MTMSWRHITVARKLLTGAVAGLRPSHRSDQRSQIAGRNPAGLPGGPFGFSLPDNPGPLSNPAGLPGGPFGFSLRPPRLRRRMPRAELGSDRGGVG
jgi:uncharacterized protein (DUF2141 family)